MDPADIVRRADAVPGWMVPGELLWLAKAGAEHRRIIEVGSWKGRSTKALALATPGVVYAVDHWKGSAPSGDATFVEASGRGADAIFAEFRANVAAEIAAGKIVPVRSESGEAVARLEALLGGERADMIFIDGDHTYESARRDIATWRPLLAEGGLLCGHDYASGWPGVVKAVCEVFYPRFRVSDSIWWVV